MSSSTINPRKKPRGRPLVDSEQVNVRLQRPILEALDDLANRLENSSRPKALRFALTSYLQADGISEQPKRLGKSFLIQLSYKHNETLVDLFGENFEDQRQGLEDLLSDWLSEHAVKAKT